MSANLRDDMRARMWERVLDHRQNFVVEGMPPLLTMPNPTFLGGFAWTTNTARFLLSRSAVRGVGESVATPSGLARAYLTEKFGGKRRRCTTAQYDLLLKDFRTSPLYCRPAWSGEFVAIDLKAAYWQILSRVGWDVDYYPNKWIGVKSDVTDFPYAHHKLMRNLLVSAGLPARVQWWDGKKIRSRKGRNPLYNGILWAFVQDVLNAVAVDMLEIGALHIHTDGYILPASEEALAMQILDEWTLIGEVRARGDGWIKQVGRWRVGMTEVGRRDILSSKDMNKVRVEPYQQWLKRSFSAQPFRRLNLDCN